MESNGNSLASTRTRGLKHRKQLMTNISSYGRDNLYLADGSTTWWSHPLTTDVYNISKTYTTINSHASEDNKYSSSLFHPSSYERGFNTSAYVGIFLCTFGIFLNLLLFAIVFSIRKLRLKYVYVQVLNIALADLSYIVTVDSFTIYFELQSWQLGVAFCKTWMILDVALPSVSLFALLLLNLDRIAFAYMTSFYQFLMQRKVSLIMILLGPWGISCFIVNTLWLWFPAVDEENLPGVCMYGITKEANVASIWLTVFLPSLLIFVLLIFIFIAGIGELPTVGLAPSSQPSINNDVAMSSQAHTATKVSEQVIEQTTSIRRTRSSSTASNTSISDSRRQRRFVAALLAVDFISLAITLPYSAYSQVTISCLSLQSCQSWVTLFQILSWMKSSITCVRPVFFILLTDICLSLKKCLSRTFSKRWDNRDALLGASQQREQGCLILQNKRNYDNITLAHVNFGSLYSRNNSTITIKSTPPQSPSQSKSLLDKKTQIIDATHVNNTGEGNVTFV